MTAITLHGKKKKVNLFRASRHDGKEKFTLNFNSKI
jgi:hypothetical protein